MQIQWDGDVDDVLRNAVIRFINEHAQEGLLPNGGAGLSVRKAWLPFYPRLAFVELTDQPTAPPAGEGENKEPPPPRRLYALLDPDMDEVTPLDMTNGPVYGLNNKGHLRIRDDKEAIAYTAFFFSCVAGPYGLMPVVENLSTEETADMDDEMKAILERLSKTHIPPTAQREGASWRVFAALLFQKAVFQTEIVIDTAGVVRVDKHELALSTDETPPEEAQKQN